MWGCDESDLAVYLQCTDMGSSALCVLIVPHRAMSCGRWLHPPTFLITKLNVAWGTKRCIKSSILLIGFSYHYFCRMKYAVVIKRKIYGKSSLCERLKVKAVLVLISFSYVSIHQVNAADFHSAQSHSIWFFFFFLH